eukprot:CAMPEP_0170471232 /NCGR_PEP_ID=MMETSP0123-20130129/13501_1 /TAXON_ID=182087 /ORGANISM="Favella ehrenbergii, Strain Fehren 1" /LENGTH=53 /DNA_ID=CAMNT_0010738773 /DNA_START=62 /DNA_END=223 /DNA_ORIENTATION=+
METKILKPSASSAALDVHGFEDDETADCTSTGDDVDFKTRMEAFMNYEPAYTA